MNAASMIDAADNKFIFDLAIEGCKPNTTAINFNTFNTNVMSALKGFRDEKFVLKPVDAARGTGVVILSRIELETHCSELAAYFSQKSKEINIPLFFDKYRKNKIIELHQHAYQDNVQTILLQSYIASDFLQINGSNYDPTGRVVLFLQKKSEVYEVTVIDGYWKLPEKPISTFEDTGISRLSHVTAENNDITQCGSAKFTDRQKQAIIENFKRNSALFSPLLQSKTTFFLEKISQLAPATQLYLSHYFVSELFDIFKEEQFLHLSTVLPKLPGIELALLRSLAIEVSIFQYHAMKDALSAQFLHSKLLSFLASDCCAIDFSKVRYHLDKRQDIKQLLIDMLPCFTQVYFPTFIDERTKLNAEKLRKKIQTLAAPSKILPVGITNAHSLWASLDMEYNIIPTAFLCPHSQKIMDEPIFIKSQSKYYDHASAIALQFKSDDIKQDTEFKQIILQFLFRCAQSKSIYDNFRVVFDISPSVNKERLLELAPIFGNGVKHPLIIVTETTVSINKFWLDLQLHPTARGDFLRDVGLATV